VSYLLGAIVICLIIGFNIAAFWLGAGATLERLVIWAVGFVLWVVVWGRLKPEPKAVVSQSQRTAYGVVSFIGVVFVGIPIVYWFLIYCSSWWQSLSGVGN